MYIWNNNTGKAKTKGGLSRHCKDLYAASPTVKWPRLLQFDLGREFMGAVNQHLAKHSIDVRRGRLDVRRARGIGERFNRTLAKRLFRYQYAHEMRLPEGMKSSESGWLAYPQSLRH